MTYDELLARINHFKVVPFDPLVDSLSAVVELHKPSLGKACVECSKTAFWIAYPCRTIQAIEKELF